MKDLNTTLILAVDGRKFEKPFRDYEKELLLCLKAWSNFYTNPIILVCPSPFLLSTNTKKAIEKYKNITYIEDQRYYSEDITCGFDMKALVGKLIQKDYIHLIETEYILNIDLDMYLINYIPEYLYEIVKTKTIIGRYTNTDSLEDKINDGIIYIDKDPFDTGFILTQKDSEFFINWEKDISNIRNVLNGNKKIETGLENLYVKTKNHLPLNLKIDSIEEWLISYYNSHNIYPIHSLYDYQYGEFYPKYLIKNIDTCLFFHYHYYVDMASTILNIIKKYKK